MENNVAADLRFYDIQYGLKQVGAEVDTAPNPVYIGLMVPPYSEITKPFTSFWFGIRHNEQKGNSPVFLFAGFSLPEHAVEDDLLPKTIEAVGRINAHRASSVAKTGVWTLSKYNERYMGLVLYRLKFPDDLLFTPSGISLDSFTESFKSFFEDVLAYGEKVQAVLSGESDFDQVFCDVTADEPAEEPPNQQFEEPAETPEAVPTEEEPQPPVREEQQPQEATRTQATEDIPVAPTREESSRNEDKGTWARDAVFIFISFLIPIVGIIFSLLWKKSKPKLSKKLFIAAIAGIAAYVLPVVF